MAEPSVFFEEIRELFRESDRKFKEQNEKFDRRMKAMDKRHAGLSSSVGKMIEHMIRKNIAGQFQALGYDVTEIGRNHSFENDKLGIRGEIDVVLYDGDVVILIEVKTTLEIYDVRKHIERLEKYRRHVDAKPIRDNKRYVGAVAGAVVSNEVINFAHENGLYAIVQSGKAVEIVPPPKGFKAKEW
jgi:hypothetical protein